jgi:hypothetical protein
MRQSAVTLEELWFHTIPMSCDVPAAEWQKLGALWLGAGWHVCAGAACH